MFLKSANKYFYHSRKLYFCERSSRIEYCTKKIPQNGTGLGKLPPVDYSIAQVTKDDIKYVLFKYDEPDYGISVTENTIKNKYLDKTLPIKVLLHGWMSSGLKAPWYTALRTGYFHIGPHYIFCVDYTIPGSENYEKSAANAQPVGRFIGQFLLSSKILHEKIHLISHSLGSHVASFVGKEIYESTGKKIARITALDPASRKFESEGMSMDLRLNQNDAEFVDAVHTDTEFSGFASPLGHVDFYPNYGRHQPGCPKKEVDVNCSHSRSKYYFAESLSMRNCKAQEAKTIGSGKATKIEVTGHGKEIIFGDNVPVTARGVYYLKTNAEQPFLIGS